MRPLRSTEDPTAFDRRNGRRHLCRPAVRVTGLQTLALPGPTTAVLRRLATSTPTDRSRRGKNRFTASILNMNVASERATFGWPPHGQS